MADVRAEKYAEELGLLIKEQTVSENNQTDKSVFHRMHKILKELCPNLFGVVAVEEFDGSLLLRWAGKGDGEPILLMNHHDVVEAHGQWKYPPFSGTVAQNKIWGRGTLDTKSGLYSMLKAADELIADGFIPERDVYFVTTCNEECSGVGADVISNELKRRGLRFYLVLDEGGMIIEEPISGAKGKFAMVGLGEKGCMDLKFIARSNGGHASTPTKNTPLVRLGKFMAAVESKNLFKADISPVVAETFYRIGRTMKGFTKFALGHPRLFKPILKRILPKFSASANAVIRSTVAFTMASGSKGANVLPNQAYVVANLRYSHHQGRDKSVEVLKKLADKFQIETEIVDEGYESPLSDYKSQAFGLIERAVSEIFTDVKTCPYVMTAASDCRYMTRISENCFRFVPLSITDEQLSSIHGINENLDISALPLAVDFYKYVITEA